MLAPTVQGGSPEGGFAVARRTPFKFRIPNYIALVASASQAFSSAVM